MEKCQWEKTPRKSAAHLGRVSESIVEIASPCASNMSENAVESDASILIRVEALIDKIAQEPSILRDSFAIDASRGRDRVRCMLGIRCEIANDGESASSDHRIGDDV